MEKLKRSDSVIELGKRIVKELSMEKGTDTLGRWMAHYIAELIESAENCHDAVEKEKAEEKCFSMILKLWEHRSTLPRSINPIMDYAHILEAIEYYMKPVKDILMFGNKQRIKYPWIDFAYRILKLCRSIYSKAIIVSLEEVEPEEVSDILELIKKEDFLSGIEDDIMNKIKNILERSGVSDENESLTREEFVKQNLDEVEMNIKEIHKIFESLLVKLSKA